MIHSFIVLNHICLLLLSHHTHTHKQTHMTGPSIRAIHPSQSATPKSRRSSTSNLATTSNHASPKILPKASLSSTSLLTHPLQQHKKEMESSGMALVDSGVVEGLVRKWEDVIEAGFEVKVRETGGEGNMVILFLYG